MDWFYELPLVTRVYLTSTAAVTIGDQLGWLTILNLYFDPSLVFSRGDYWRLITTFLYYGSLSLDWAIHMYFGIRYMSDLEQGSFYNRRADFIWFLLYSCIVLLAIGGPLIGILFHGPALSAVLLYLWARRNPDMQISFFGVLDFRAPYLPFVMVGFEWLVSRHGTLPRSDLAGIIIGHVYYFFADVWPNHPSSGGFRLFRTPNWFKRLCGEEP
ncbi:Der1-like protein, partial [Ramicandelaber brevisporus]